MKSNLKYIRVVTILFYIGIIIYARLNYENSIDDFIEDNFTLLLIPFSTYLVISTIVEGVKVIISAIFALLMFYFLGVIALALYLMVSFVLNFFFEDIVEDIIGELF